MLYRRCGGRGHGSVARVVSAQVAVCCSDCARSSTDRASDYGSEGWGFESLRARPGQSPFPSPEGALLLTQCSSKCSNGTHVCASSSHCPSLLSASRVAAEGTSV